MTQEQQLDIQDLKPEMASEASAVMDDDQKPLYNKRQVTDVVKREREKAADKARRDAMLEMQMQHQSQPATGATPPNTQQLGGMPQISREDIAKMIAEHAPQALNDHVRSLQNKQTVDSFVTKMKAAEEKHPGLEEKLNDLDYSTIAPLVKMANDLDNTGDIMKELVDNPMKMGNLVSLLYTQPKLAEKAMRDLSHSIKANESALAQEKSSTEPYSQMKPSINAGKDDGNMSTSDFRAQSWLRG